MTLQKAASVQGGDGELGVSGDNRGASPVGAGRDAPGPGTVVAPREQGGASLSFETDDT